MKLKRRRSERVSTNLHGIIHEQSLIAEKFSKMDLNECPFCHEDIEQELLDSWVGDKYSDFVFECPKCNASFRVDVELEPFFWCSKQK